MTKSTLVCREATQEKCIEAAGIMISATDYRSTVELYTLHYKLAAVEHVRRYIIRDASHAKM